MATTLIDNASEDVVSDPVQLNGGPAILIVRGDEFDTALVSFETTTSADTQERYDTLDNSIFTAPGTRKLDYSSPTMKIRARLSGSQASTDGIFVVIDQ